MATTIGRGGQRFDPALSGRCGFRFHVRSIIEFINTTHIVMFIVNGVPRPRCRRSISTTPCISMPIQLQTNANNNNNNNHIYTIQDHVL